MKPIQKRILATFGGIALTTASALASDTLADGDLGIVFFSVNGSNVVGPDTYVINLGAASLYRENTQNNVAVSAINTALASSSIGADLTATFGDTWHNDGFVRWAVVGGVPQPDANTTGPINGDPLRTTYYSRARSSFATGALGAGSTISTVSQTNRGILANNIEGFFTGTNNGIGQVAPNTSTSGVNVAGAVIPTTNLQSIEEYLPPTVLTNFGIGISPTQTLVAGQLAGGAGIEGALDIFRIIDTTTNADLTAGASASNAVPGAGQFIGSLTIDASGNLKIVAVGVANPDSDSDGMLDTWEIAYFTDKSQGATDDFDKDGTDNLTEFRLGLIPNSGSSRFAAVRAANGQITWSSATGVTFKVLRSTSLAAGSWLEIDTVAGTAGTASYTDPAPPVGNAFYRIALQP